MKKIFFAIGLLAIQSIAANENPLKADLDIDGVVVKSIPSMSKELQKCPCVKKWLDKAQKDDLIAMYALGNCFGIAPKSNSSNKSNENYCSMSPKLYADWMGVAATRGFAPAQYAYGTAWFYGSGTKSLSQDKGIKWWAQSASQGWAEAYFSLGDIYENGLGRKKDLNKARLLFIEAQKLGDTRAKERIKIIDQKLKK